MSDQVYEGLLSLCPLLQKEPVQIIRRHNCICYENKPCVLLRHLTLN